MQKRKVNCRCGADKPRRYLVCRECFDKMDERDKALRQSMSKSQPAGTLRRWQ
jgi:hypothetical protein